MANPFEFDSIPASDEVYLYEMGEEILLRPDWRDIASTHFRIFEQTGSKQMYREAIGALALALAKENELKTTTETINKLELMLQLPYNMAPTIR